MMPINQRVLNSALLASNQTRCIMSIIQSIKANKKDLLELVYELRFVALAIIIFVVAALIFKADLLYKITQIAFGEGGIVEWSQILFLTLTAIIFLWAGRIYPAMRELSYLLTTPAILAIIRENDFLFDTLTESDIPVVKYFSWTIPFSCVALWALYFALTHLRPLIDQLKIYVKSPSWGAITIGGTFVLFFSRLYGMGKNWRHLLKTVDANNDLSTYPGLLISVKRVAEEGTELAGYAIILFAACLFFAYCCQQHKTLSQGQPQA